MLPLICFRLLLRALTSAINFQGNFGSVSSVPSEHTLSTRSHLRLSACGEGSRAAFHTAGFSKRTIGLLQLLGLTYRYCLASILSFWQGRFGAGYNYLGHEKF